jgi:5-methylcytosine-specific restriction endonuclease McrA
VSLPGPLRRCSRPSGRPTARRSVRSSNSDCCFVSEARALAASAVDQRRQPLVSPNRFRIVNAGDEEVDILADAARALTAGDDGAARTALAPIAGQTLLSHPIMAAPQRPGRYPPGQGAKTRSPPRSVVAATYLRDSFTCVYCGRRTVVLPVLGLVSEMLPAEFPCHPNWKRDIAHRFYWDLSTTLDHVAAVSTGGDWRAEANLVTACARCQYQKGNRSLTDLGWRVQRVSSRWDGLSTLLSDLWRRAGRPVRTASWVAEYARLADHQD